MPERPTSLYPLPHPWRWLLMTLLMGWCTQAMAQRPFDAARLRAIEPLVLEAIDAGDFPGCVILAGYRGEIIFREAFGDRQQEPGPEPMTVDTIFDMASITKPVATATSVMRLVEQGKLSLSDPIAKHLPEFGSHGKADVTVFECLTHQAGFVPDSPLDEYKVPEEIWPNLCRLELVYPPRTKFVYSDVGFQVLGKLVEKVSGSTLDEFAQREVFGPLGMVDTGYRPALKKRARIAPTEKRDGEWIRGDVHDPRAFAMGNVAGHAGLFSTVDDLARYARMMLGQGGGEQEVLSPATIDVMTSAYRSGASWRGLGWDKNSRFSYNGGDLLSSGAFGHGGFTGTVLWIDPDLDFFFIILSNRLHPDGEGTINHLAGRIANVLVSALDARGGRGSQEMPSGDTQCGLDVLRESGFERLRGLRVGLIANHTSQDRNGQSSARLLHDAADVSLVCLFSPEHGIAGKLDQAEIGDTIDQETGVPVYSLYGASREPTPEQLSELDAIVFDIQDIGTRFYTYISTMGNSMRAAANQHVRFVVLDRPNPIDGVHVAGPVLDKPLESFVGFHPVPVRHGMTIGELAKMFRNERQLDLDLEVVPMRGWQRKWYWDRTGLTWVNPSPNMRTPNQALLYPGIGLLETTNISVGRGTDTPFEWVGAPWMDGRAVAARLNAMHPHGVRCVPVTFTPDASKYAGERCQGVRFVMTRRDDVRPVELGLQLACTLRDLHENQWELGRMQRLLCDEAVLAQLEAGATPESIVGGFQPELADFLIRRDQYLLYK